MKWLLVVMAAVFVQACATDPCARRDRFFSSRCVGTDVAYTPDATCKARISRCSDAQKAAFEAYVACLETANQCSLEVVARCARAHPGAVNLAC